MKIQFCGAAGEVTGSNLLVTTEDTKFIVDCGMFQGGSDMDEKNAAAFPYDPKDIDFVLLSHSHIDHSGRLPKLVKEGFHGPIYSTLATRDLCEIMLLDSAKIQENDVEWQNRKRLRAGKDLLQPLYTEKDAEDALKSFKTVHYYDKIEINPFVTVRYQDAGHILGSSIIEIWITEGNKQVKLLYSGDLGMSNRPIIRDPDMGISADYVIMESTYGNTIHETYHKMTEELIDIIDKTVSKGGTVVIPSFAVGRTQEIIYQLNEFYEYHEMEDHMVIPVYVDSPMAVEATKTYMKHSANYDDNAKTLIRKGDNPFSFQNLIYVETVEESRALNTEREPRVIISSSGMAEAGRVRHHLKHNLWDENSSVVLVGYQAYGTLGRLLQDGIDEVKLFGEPIAVKAKIYSLPGFSAHADEAMLLSWVESMEEKPKEIFLVHGEEDEQKPLAGIIQKKMNIPVHIASKEETIELNGSVIMDDEVDALSEKDIEDLYEFWDKVDSLSREMLSKKDEYLDKKGLEVRYNKINRSLLRIHRALMDMNMIKGK